jgi:hypothetical protein
MFPRTVPALLIFAAIVLIAADHNLPNKGLTVHEWGTFTSVAGEDGSAILWDPLSCPSELPTFVYDLGIRNLKVNLSGTVRMETPVLYFYAPREMQARVKVQFPQGVITEWYPKGDTGSSLQWRDILIQPDSTPVLPIENRPSHYYAARDTDAAPLAVGNEREKFLFYRGVGRISVPLSVRVDGETIVIENRSQDPVPSVILFENRGGRLGYRVAGTIRDSARLDSPSLDGSLADLRHDLEAALIAQGLFPKEAHAMVETWRDSWFEEGSRVFYIVPTHAVDAILPLNIEPAPQQIARAFVGRIELITPATIQSVEQAIANEDRATLARYDRFLGPILARIPGNRTPASVGVAQCR